MNINFIIALLIVFLFALSFIVFKCGDLEFGKQMGGSVGDLVVDSINEGFNGIGGDVMASINNINSILQ